MLNVKMMLLKNVLLVLILTPLTVWAAPPPTLNTYNLDQAIHYALEHNPDLHIASERIAQAYTQIGMARAAFYPQIGVRAGYQLSNNSLQVFSMIVAQREFNNGFMQNINDPGYRQNFYEEISGRWSLYRGGQDQQQQQIAELSAESARLDQSVIHNELIRAVTGAYYSTLAAMETEKIAQYSIDSLNSQLNQTRKRYQAGTVLRADVLSLEVQLANAQQNHLTAINAIELARSGLSVLLGLPASQTFNLASTQSTHLPTVPPSFAQLLTTAFTQRPEIQAAATRCEIAEHQLTKERGAYLPKVDAVVSYGFNNQNPLPAFNKDNVTAGISMEMDLFSGFSTQQQIRRAEHQLTEAQEQQRKIKLAVELELRDAYLKLEEALARVKVSNSSVIAAEEALRLVTVQRQAETATVTRYIEAQAATHQAKANHVLAHYDALTAGSALKKALGEWK
jgi:outer membrane protein TolC